MKVYTELEIEVILLDGADVITSSDTTTQEYEETNSNS